MKQKLAQWRSTHPPPSPLQEPLWDTVVELAGKHGVHRTARALPVDYFTLKQRLNGASKERKLRLPAFVELIAPAPPAGAGCVVEMLRVETSGTVDWTQLLAAWRQRRT